jgi:hypothetical protein
LASREPNPSVTLLTLPVSTGKLSVPLVVPLISVYVPLGGCDAAFSCTVLAPTPVGKTTFPETLILS